jgi:hypothetical protein
MKNNIVSIIMNKFAILFLSVFLLSGCLPKYIEKQSEPLKQAVYGVNDSLDKGRIDLAWYYSNETTKLVNPPSIRLDVKSLYQTVDVKKTPTGQRVVVLPEQLKGDKVIVVNTDDYKELIKNKEIAKQLQSEITEKDKFTKNIIEQQQKNEKIQSDLLNSYNNAKLKISEKDSSIWYRNFVILGLLVLIGGYIGLRVAISYGKMSLPFII